MATERNLEENQWSIVRLMNEHLITGASLMKGQI